MGAARHRRHGASALPHPGGDLRWHRALRHPSGHIGPALVALVTHAATAGPMSVHRTWLEADGAGKAALDKPRLLWPGAPRTGGVVRLWPDEEVALGLAVGEGLETALSFARGFGSAWACIDAGKLAAFPVLPGIDGLTIVADHDEAAMKAADACAARWHETWAEVRVWRARAPKADFNDWMLGRAD
jgi:putative DNA primase/helicase